MSIFDVLKEEKRARTGNPNIGLTQDEVDAINALLARWTKAHSLAHPDKFFAALKTSFGPLNQSQVDGFNRLLKTMGDANWPIAWAAYGLATVWHETAQRMQPVEEAFWKDDAWRKANLDYYPWHGRGDVQLTWKKNYIRADNELGLGGKLVANPKLALDPEISSQIMQIGMERGWFTGKKLADYLPVDPAAGNLSQFADARRIINGTDKAIVIANQAQLFQTALALGSWT